MAILEVHHIEKHFGATRVLEDISFDLEQGQALAIIGSSGSGFSRKFRHRSRVVLPEPLGPRMATNSLSRRFRLTLFSAFCTRSPVLYCLQICLICSMCVPFWGKGSGRGRRGEERTAVPLRAKRRADCTEESI